MNRSLLLLLLLPLALAAQEPTENPQTPREFSRATARTLRQYPELCTRPVRWVLAFDISRSGMGRWSDWARQVVSDLISYTMVEGDRLTLIPFDNVVNPPRGGRPGGASFPTWEITAAGKGEVREQVAELLLWRQDSPPGTAWVAATEAALRTAAKASDPGRLAIAMVISDRDSADLLREERSAVKQVAGLQPLRQSLWPLPRDVKPIVVLHAAARHVPAATAGLPTRYMPPWEPPSGIGLVPVPAPAARRLPWFWWLLAAALAVVGLALVLNGMAVRKRVELRWGFRQDDPAGQVTVALAPGTRKLLQASGDPDPDPFCLFADGAANPVQRKAVIRDLGALVVEPDWVTLRSSDQYLVRQSGETAWSNQVVSRRGAAPSYLEFKLANQTWPLTREPVGLQVLATGRDWRQRTILGGVLLAVGLLILLTARPRPAAAPQPLLPAPASGQPTEPLCGG